VMRWDEIEKEVKRICLWPQYLKYCAYGHGLESPHLLHPAVTPPRTRKEVAGVIALLIGPLIGIKGTSKYHSLILRFVQRLGLRSQQSRPTREVQDWRKVFQIFQIFH